MQPVKSLWLCADNNHLRQYVAAVAGLGRSPIPVVLSVPWDKLAYPDWLAVIAGIRDTRPAAVHLKLVGQTVKEAAWDSSDSYRWMVHNSNPAALLRDSLWNRVVAAVAKLPAGVDLLLDWEWNVGMLTWAHTAPTSPPRTRYQPWIDQAVAFWNDAVNPMALRDRVAAFSVEMASHGRRVIHYGMNPGHPYIGPVAASIAWPAADSRVDPRGYSGLTFDHLTAALLFADDHLQERSQCLFACQGSWSNDGNVKVKVETFLQADLGGLSGVFVVNDHEIVPACRAAGVWLANIPMVN